MLSFLNLNTSVYVLLNDEGKEIVKNFHKSYALDPSVINDEFINELKCKRKGLEEYFEFSWFGFIDMFGNTADGEWTPYYGEVIIEADSLRYKASDIEIVREQ